MNHGEPEWWQKTIRAITLQSGPNSGKMPIIPPSGPGQQENTQTEETLVAGRLKTW